MNNDLAQIAIQTALNGDWKEAVKINQEILKNTPNDIDALNRQAKAMIELSKLTEAKKIINKIILIDPANTIAIKLLEKLKLIKKGGISKCPTSRLTVFLEESGKTKIINLINLGDKQLLIKLGPGDEVKFNTHPHKINVTTKDGKYIGRIPDDLSARLKNLITKGYLYEICIKTINIDEVKVFVRETQRPVQFSDVPSFTSEKIEYISFTPPELVHKKEDDNIADESDHNSSNISNNPHPEDLE